MAMQRWPFTLGKGTLGNGTRPEKPRKASTQGIEGRRTPAEPRQLEADQTNEHQELRKFLEEKKLLG